MVKRSESIKAYVAAMFAIQQVLGKAKKSSDNPYFKSRYADLETVNDCIDDAMVTAEKNLLIQQYPTTVSVEGKNMVIVTTRITEPNSGEFEEIEVSSPLVDDKAQSFGSTVTYLRRYSLVSIFNISTEDDDGNAGSGNNGKPQQMTGKAPSWASNSRPPSAPLTTGTGIPASVPSTREVNQQIPQTNAQRTVSGFIDSVKYDELKVLIKTGNITLKNWKMWLKEFYMVEGIAEIKLTDFEAIKAAVAKNPAFIANYVTREPGQD